MRCAAVAQLWQEKFLREDAICCHIFKMAVVNGGITTSKKQKSLTQSARSQLL